MAAKSDYLEAATLDAAFGKAAFPSVTNVYVALHTADPTDAGTGAEAAYTSYARVSTSPAGWTRTAGSITNGNAITFPAATGGSETVTHFALWDASTAGNLLYHGAIDSSLAVSSGITPTIGAGALTVTEA